MTLTPGKSCPVCARPVAARYAPFCSKRCSDVDLGRWLNEDYAFPVLPDEDAGAPSTKAGGASDDKAGDDDEEPGP